MEVPESSAETFADRVDTPLRERKKALTRRAILDAADRLFSAKGFDQVTVAEIADAANVSVKTLFVYFRSKEDLVFSDYELLDVLVSALASRPPDTSSAMAIAEALIEQLRKQRKGITGIVDWHRAYGDSSALQSGLLRMWSVFEDRIADELAREQGRPTTVAIRFHAMQLVGLVRLTTSKELLAELNPVDPRGLSKFVRLIRKVARSIDG
jgi:AcrR family transcriptional regulator